MKRRSSPSSDDDALEFGVARQILIRRRPDIEPRHTPEDLAPKPRASSSTDGDERRFIG